jgi:signal transduction histidine kinase
MYSQMLADGMVPDDSARHEYLETLRRESDRLARVVESVLLYAHVEDGRGGTHRERLSAAALLDRVLPALGQRADAGAMELDIEAEDLEHCEVEVDVQAVEQILLNLVDNACKYAASAFDRRLHVKAAASKDQLEILFSDHGPGIPAAEEAAVFVPFRRAAAHMAGPIPGVGLGLALARGLARALGGDLELLRRPQSGATFRLTVPLIARATRAA